MKKLFGLNSILILILFKKKSPTVGMSERSEYKTFWKLENHTEETNPPPEEGYVSNLNKWQGGCDDVRNLEAATLAIR